MPALGEDESRSRAAAADHAVLGTIHASRGVDLVPVVFALVAGRVVIPVDRVKAKSTTRLQRLANIDADPRASVLVEHYDGDWARLWWVRASGRAEHRAVDPASHHALAARYPAYTDADTIDRVIVVTPETWSGWMA